MRKLIASALLMVSLSAFAVETASVQMPTGTITNLTLLAPGSACTVNSIQLLSGANQAGSCILWDIGTATNAIYIPAYTNFTTTATNLITLWTNYYGATNYVTNYALVRASNSVPAASVQLPAIFTLTSPSTNTAVTFSGLNTIFTRGITITNTSAGTITVTVGYTQ